MQGFSVSIEYRDKDMNKIGEMEYSLKDYVEKQRYDMMKVLVDIEGIIYKATNGKEKEEWPKEYMDMFKDVRHRIFDIANSVSRIPSTMKYNGNYIFNIPPSQFISKSIPSE